MKADRGKAIAWRSVSCKMTCYHIPNEKNSLDPQSAFNIRSAVSSLHFVLTDIRGSDTVYFLLSYSHNTHNRPQNTCVWVNSTYLFFTALILFPVEKNVDTTYNVSINPIQKITLACIACLCSRKWCHACITGLCTKNDISHKFWAHLISVMVCGLRKSLVN